MEETQETNETEIAAAPQEEAATVTPREARHRRQEKTGLVTSDKMQKTVVVRVERQVQHPKYRRYIRRRKKFLAHDEIGAKTGDIVRILETRPMSARKRWRVVEIIQKAR
ncbi:MAG: 30S ribosomal protein S17 [Blastocatellia bacterium AA13]|nr:MAG: 30S ribosomal protein S17 [Blastocatellia bacterium AA13]